jgi:hypothetical protein
LVALDKVADGFVAVGFVAVWRDDTAVDDGAVDARVADDVVADAPVATALVVPAPVGLEPPQADTVASAHTLSPARSPRTRKAREARAGSAWRVTRPR